MLNDGLCDAIADIQSAVVDWRQLDATRYLG
jgi:hypothetical protein